MSWNINDLEESLLIGSTLVEGSTLTEDEARDILRGRTVAGHPVSESRELLNYRAAIQWLMNATQATPFVSDSLIREFHQRLFQGFPGLHGRWKNQANFTYRSDGSRHTYVKPSRVGTAVSSWLGRFNQDADISTAPKDAAELYYEFQNIHPFEDGNGRIGRILIAYWFHWKHGLSWSFFQKDKVEHLRALEQANQGKLELLITFFQARLSGKKS